MFFSNISLESIQAERLVKGPRRFNRYHFIQCLKVVFIKRLHQVSQHPCYAQQS